MKVIDFNSPGPPEVLKIIETEIPTPDENELLIKVIAAGVNRPDLLQREGLYPAPEGHSKILGLEVSGIVEKIGKNISNFTIGDKVCALLDGGGYAEYATAKEMQTTKFPENLNYIEAAALPECFITCWSNLVDRGKIKRNQNVLIHGGASGIGTTAIQILKLFDSNIFTTVGNNTKKKFCESLGAQNVINYNNEDFFEFIKKKKIKIDLILDMVGGDYLQKNIDLLSNDGKLINIAFLKGSIVNVNFMKVMLRRLTITGSTLRIRDENFKGAVLRNIEKNIFPKIKDGTIKPIIDSTFKLDEASKAHQRVYNDDHIGKVVIEI